jgi:hypothetical protein
VRVLEDEALDALTAATTRYCVGYQTLVYSSAFALGRT